MLSTPATPARANTPCSVQGRLPLHADIPGERLVHGPQRQIIFKTEFLPNYCHAHLLALFCATGFSWSRLQGAVANNNRTPRWMPLELGSGVWEVLGCRGQRAQVGGLVSAATRRPCEWMGRCRSECPTGPRAGMAETVPSPRVAVLSRLWNKIDDAQRLLLHPVFLTCRC